MRKLLLLTSLVLLGLSAAAQQTRHFTFHYAFAVNNIQPGAKLDIWLPEAHSDQFQDVKIVTQTGDLPLHEARDAKYGNAMFHASTPKADKPEYRFEVVYYVVRHERVALPREGARAQEIKASAKDTSQYLGADRLVPTGGKLAAIAATEVQGKTGTLDRARGLYDYTFRTMRYDKSGTGWGRGDAEWACDSRRGNCTDFHSVFISMARSQGIPARFDIGFPIPANKDSAEIPGYHCWAEFYDSAYGWVPVDISEAWKDPAKKDYFFGDLDVNRIQFSLGRDLILSPAQAGPPLNYFIYPYAEVNGEPWQNVANQFSFNSK